MKVKINRTMDVSLPHRAHYNDAGADVFAPTDIVLPPRSIVKFDLGWSIEIPDTYMGLLMPRSGLTSTGIVSEYTPIDSGYRGNVYGMLHNMSDKEVTIKQGYRICQLVIVPVLTPEFVENLGEERGTGGFASTGK